MERTEINAMTIKLGADSPLNQQFRKLETYILDARKVYASINSSEFNHEVDWNFGDRKFEIYLYPYDIRHPDYTLQISTESGVQYLDPGPSYTYRGWNLKDPSKEVRLSITPTYVTGFITDVDGSEWYIQASSDFGDKTN